MTGIIPNPNTPMVPPTSIKTFTITHVGPIDENFVNSIINIVNSLPSLPEQLTISISSGGGSVIHGITAYNYLKQLPCLVHTHNMGEVSSSAILPYLAGSVRTADNVSKFMFHPVTVGLNEQMTHPKFLEMLSMLERDINNYASIVQREVPDLCARHDIVALLKHDTLVLTPADGLNCGLLTA